MGKAAAGTTAATGTGTGTALVVAEDQLRFSFAVDGTVTDLVLGSVSLDLDPETSMETWLELGRQFGELDRRTRWWIGDWLNFGEATFGEDSAQGVDDPASRYDHVNRITGLEQQTLINISSICRRVARARRRQELSIWMHGEVAALEPDEQVRWLEEAVANKWSRTELRAAIRAAAGDGGGQEPPLDDDDAGKKPSLSERLAIAARLVYDQSQRATDGSFIVPAEAMSQLAAALGES